MTGFQIQCKKISGLTSVISITVTGPIICIKLIVTHLWVAVMLAGKQVAAQVEADGEVLLACVDLGLEALMVVHKKLDA